MTIGMLPDDVLLEIFDRYKKNDGHINWNWVLLVHVCRRWRQVVFSQPLCLELQILCTSITPVKKNLDIWPALPIAISSFCYDITNDDEDNIITALKHIDRVWDIKLHVNYSELEKIATVMQEPFPVLKSLYINSQNSKTAALPAKFLGGSAPCLQEIDLNSIPFVELPTLLLSTNDLVYLDLRNIPPSGYISPEAMVAGLAALPRLVEFVMAFRSAVRSPALLHQPPVTRTVLPALTFFLFAGTTVAGIWRTSLPEYTPLN